MENNQKLFNEIKTNLYDIQSSVEAVKDEFKRNNIEVDNFLSTIDYYIVNINQLKKFQDKVLLNLLFEKLQFIRNSFQHSDLYNSEIKASINYIIKHQHTFFTPKLKVKRINYNTNFQYLNSIKIKNYFSIKNIEITNLKDKKEIYFVGKNGDGKTVLLQAILLALKKEYDGRVIEYIRDIQNEMSLWVEVSDYPNKYHSNLDIKNVFAYGINRNKIDKNFDKYGYMGLFDSSDFRDTTYLKDPIDILNKKEKLVEAFIKEMNKYILLDNLEIKRDKKRIYFIENDIEIEFDKLSEGYKSSIIWVTDLFSRLLENQKDIKKIQEFRAIVLIDEIDLYLHPKWQYAFVNGLREMFPLIQFFIITHSPTIILGASMDAVYYHIYKENGETKISEQQEIKNDFLNDIQTDIFNFDVNEERINNPTNDNKRRQQRAKEGLSNLIETIEQEEK